MPRSDPRLALQAWLRLIARSPLRAHHRAGAGACGSGTSRSGWGRLRGSIRYRCLYL